MIKILFICHGNICRSPMAEFICKELIRMDPLLDSDDFEIDSAAVSTEETGNDIYPPSKRKLREKGIPFAPRHARQIRSEDYEKYDYLIGMDQDNLYRMRRFFGRKEKLYLFTEFAGLKREIADPWYTDDFEKTYQDILLCGKSLLEYIKQT